jgi:hypothetical protein
MPIPLSPELVLVLPEEQREAAIRLLPPPPVWSPGPLGPAVLIIARRATHLVVGALLLYFAVRLLWVLGTLAVYVVTIVGVIILLVLIF